jgi:peptide/nickel transport system permease protein
LGEVKRMTHIIFRALVRLFARASFVALAVGALSFLLMRSLPGDAAFRIAAGRYGYDMVDAAAAESVRRELGLDRSGFEQFVQWLSDLLQFRLGESMVSGIPVIEEIGYQLGSTLQLSIVAWLMALLLGCVLGAAMALRGGATSDFVARSLDALCTLLRASPSFLIGVVLMLLLAVHLKWLPVAGHDEAQSIVLPALTLALALGAGIAQVVRYRLAQVLASESFEYALTKGVPLRHALLRHAAPAVALPALAYAGVQLVLLIEGVVVVESLFAWPGIGHALLHAVIARDVPMIQGTALVMALIFVLFNALVDLLVKLLDPRLREMATHKPAFRVQRARV